MKMILEVDLENMSCKILRISSLTKRDIIKITCDYFTISYEDLRKTPLSRQGEYVLCRQLISYYLYTNLKLSYYEIGRLLKYSVTPESNSIVGKNINTITEAIEHQDQQIIRSYNNITKLLEKFITV